MDKQQLWLPGIENMVTTVQVLWKGILVLGYFTTYTQ